MAPSDLSRLKIPPENREARTAHRGSPLWVVILVGVVSALAMLWFTHLSRPSGGESDSAAVGSAGKSPPIKSESGKTESGVLPDSTTNGRSPLTSSLLTATGYVVAQRKASVSSKATGILKELRVVEGDTVKKDDVIGILDNEDLLSRIKEREAAVTAAKAAVESQAATVYEMARDLVRAESLRTTKVISAADFDKAQAAQKRAVAELRAREEQVKLAEAQLKGAEVELDYTFIKAPFDGTVLTKNADVGEVVSPLGASTQARAAVVTIADMASLQVEADVSEANIGRIAVGRRAEIILDAYPDVVYQGVVERIVPTVDKAKATVLTKVKFLAIDSKVIPEMSAKVRFRAE